jgi:hypothetical protein
MVDDDSRLVLSCRGLKGRLNRMNPKRELTSRFERIEYLKNFDVEKWYNFNFLFAESFK